jgi:radical SAM superfamily enzyme YgiQ (UPF0313 family)
LDVAGGPLFTSSPGDFDEVDHLVLNEAELTLPPFLEDLQKGCARRSYTTDAWSDVKDTPIPLWHLINKKKYAAMNIQYSRGCPFDCEFCDITALFGRKPRQSPANRSWPKWTASMPEAGVAAFSLSTTISSATKGN